MRALSSDCSNDCIRAWYRAAQQMGFDVSFHPLSPSAVACYVLEPLADPALREERLQQLTIHRPHRDALAHSVFDRLPALDEVRERRRAFNTTIGFATAIVAGYLHPYWCVRGAALTFWVGRDRHVEPLLSSLGAEVPQLAGIRDEARFTENSCSGAYVAPGRIAELEAYLKKAARDPAFREEWGDPAPLAQALKYAKQHGLGVLEATEIVDASGTLSLPENLRADYKRNLKKTTNAAHGRLTRATRDALVAAVREHWAEIEDERFDVVIEPEWRLEPDVVRLLALHCTSARRVLAPSIHTAPELLEHMALGEAPRDEPDIDHSHVLIDSLENPRFPVAAMPKLLAVKKPSLGVLIGLARNPSTPADLLERVLSYPRAPAARIAIAKHPNATAAMLSELASDALKEARLAARSHPNYRE
jgi:hypothetical protein